MIIPKHRRINVDVFAAVAQRHKQKLRAPPGAPHIRFIAKNLEKTPSIGLTFVLGSPPCVPRDSGTLDNGSAGGFEGVHPRGVSALRAGGFPWSPAPRGASASLGREPDGGRAGVERRKAERGK